MSVEDVLKVTLDMYITHSICKIRRNCIQRVVGVVFE